MIFVTRMAAVQGNFTRKKYSEFPVRVPRPTGLLHAPPPAATATWCYSYLEYLLRNNNNNNNTRAPRIRLPMIAAIGLSSTTPQAKHSHSAPAAASSSPAAAADALQLATALGNHAAYMARSQTQSLECNAVPLPAMCALQRGADTDRSRIYSGHGEAQDGFARSTCASTSAPAAVGEAGGEADSSKAWPDPWRSWSHDKVAAPAGCVSSCQEAPEPEPEEATARGRDTSTASCGVDSIGDARPAPEPREDRLLLQQGIAGWLPRLAHRSIAVAVDPTRQLSGCAAPAAAEVAVAGTTTHGEEGEVQRVLERLLSHIAKQPPGPVAGNRVTRLALALALQKHLPHFFVFFVCRSPADRNWRGGGRVGVHGGGVCRYTHVP